MNGVKLHEFSPDHYLRGTVENRCPRLGCWNIPEAQLKLLPDDMSGARAIELGSAQVMWRAGSPGAGRKS
jgi:hypothetical protein